MLERVLRLKMCGSRNEIKWENLFKRRNYTEYN